MAVKSSTNYILIKPPSTYMMLA